MSFYGIQKMKSIYGITTKPIENKFLYLQNAINVGDMEEFERLFDLLSNEDQLEWLNKSR